MCGLRSTFPFTSIGFNIIILMQKAHQNYMNIRERCILFAGSNSHNNGNPAGDGQAGDAGEGTRGDSRES